MNHTSLQEKEAIGITEVAQQSRPDDRFYWVTDSNDGSFTTIDKAINDDQANNSIGLKTQWVNQIKTTAGTMLNPTDWMVIRKAERNIDIPSNVTTYRTAVITEASRLETEINAVTTIPNLITVVQSQNWPRT